MTFFDLIDDDFIGLMVFAFANLVFGLIGGYYLAKDFYFSELDKRDKR